MQTLMKVVGITATIGLHSLASAESRLFMESNSSRNDAFVVTDENRRELYLVSVKNTQGGKDFFAEISDLNHRVFLRAFRDSNTPTSPRKIFFEDDQGHEVGYVLEESTPNKVRVTFFEDDKIVAKAGQNQSEGALFDLRAGHDGNSQLVKVLRGREGFRWEQSFTDELVDSRWIFAYVALVSREQALEDPVEKVRELVPVIGERPGLGEKKDRISKKIILAGGVATVAVIGGIFYWKFIKPRRQASTNIPAPVAKPKPESQTRWYSSYFDPSFMYSSTSSSSGPSSESFFPRRRKGFEPDPTGPNRSATRNMHNVINENQ